MNISEHLCRSARLFPDRVALRFEGQSVTYAQLDQWSQTAAAFLQNSGVGSGERIAIMLANVPAFAVWYFAAVRIGGIAVSISTRSAPAEVAYLTNDCLATCFVTDEPTLELVRTQLPDCVTTAVSTCDLGETINGQVKPSTTVNDVQADPHDPAAILYTSGTTGFAKGATLSHMNVRSNVCAFNHLCNQRADDRILLAVPLFHCFGQNALLNSALNVGATLVLQRKFDLNESRRLITEEQISQLSGVPMMFQLLHDSCEPQDLNSVNYCFSAAATLPVQVGERWHRKFGLPIHEGYGLTETSPFASYNHRDRFVAGSIGTPIDCVEMKVVDTDTGTECGPGEPGEIIIRGPNVMLGYWNREEETAAAIRDGWFHSGDIGRVDDGGFFYIVDRVKDMITVGGMKVFPAEVERVLLDHPAVAQVAVVGMPDDVFGEQVVAFLVLNEDPSTDEVLASVSQHAKAQLANYKVPRKLVPIAELPRNPSGKILKRKLREFDFASLARQQSEGDDGERQTVRPLQPATLRPLLQQTHAANRKRVATEFLQSLVQTLADSDTRPEAEDRFIDAGLDSLMIVELSNQLQAELGAEHEIPATLVFDYPRISDLAGFIVETLMPEPKHAGEPTADTNTARTSNDLRTEIESMSEDEALAELMKELD